MKHCAKGAIISHDELKVFAGACEVAAEYIRITINSDERPVKATHDAEYLRYMKSLRDSLALYKRTAARVSRLLAKAGKAARV